MLFFVFASCLASGWKNAISTLNSCILLSISLQTGTAVMFGSAQVPNILLPALFQEAQLNGTGLSHLYSRSLCASSASFRFVFPGAVCAAGVWALVQPPSPAAGKAGFGRWTGQTGRQNFSCCGYICHQIYSLSLGLLHLMWETNYSRSYEAVHTAHLSASDWSNTCAWKMGQPYKIPAPITMMTLACLLTQLSCFDSILTSDRQQQMSRA